MERLLETKMPEETSRVLMLIDKNRLEFLDARDTHEKQLQALEQKLLGPSGSVQSLFSQNRPQSKERPLDNTEKK